MILDSNVWVAFFDKDDSSHSKAAQLVGSLRDRIILPEYVLLEVTAVLSQKAGKSLADTFLQKVFANRDVQILYSSQRFLDEVVRLYLSRTNGKLSFVDYALLYLSHKTNVVTFDKDLKKELVKTK